MSTNGIADTPNHSKWIPGAFRIWVLLTSAVICWVLIIVLQLLLVRSQRDGGIVFAANTNDVPISQSFLYLYLPTIIALLYSVFWSWIDLQVKRMEPYYQLSKPGGALGKNSLLLQYPFEFLPFVPISAMKNRYVLISFQFPMTPSYGPWTLNPETRSGFTLTKIGTGLSSGVVRPSLL